MAQLQDVERSLIALSKHVLAIQIKDAAPLEITSA